jgi:hypothetical protein
MVLSALSAFFDTNYVLTNLKDSGVPGVEPGLSVLETDVLTIDTIPLENKSKGEERKEKAKLSSFAFLHPT